jgi:hypothetical protein
MKATRARKGRTCKLVALDSALSAEGTECNLIPEIDIDMDIDLHTNLTYDMPRSLPNSTLCALYRRLACYYSAVVLHSRIRLISVQGASTQISIITTYVNAFSCNRALGSCTRVQSPQITTNHHKSPHRRLFDWRQWLLVQAIPIGGRDRHFRAAAIAKIPLERHGIGGVP